jgi:hypothetical protein
MIPGTKWRRYVNLVWAAPLMILTLGSGRAEATPDGIEYIAVTAPSSTLLMEARWLDVGGYRSVSNIGSASGLPLKYVEGAGVAEDSQGGLQIIAFNDQSLLHSIRYKNDTWQQAWGDVASVVGSPGSVKRIAMCSTEGQMHVVVLTRQNQMLHTIRNDDGSWQVGWDDVVLDANDASFASDMWASLNSPRGVFVDVGCAADYTTGEVQVAVVMGSGRVWHTIRYQNQPWQPFGDVIAAVGGASPGTVTSLGMTEDGANMQMMLGTADGKLYHTIRFADGSWQNYFGYVPGQESATQNGIRQISATINYSGAVFVALDDFGTAWQTVRYSDTTWQSTWSSLRSLSPSFDIDFLQITYYNAPNN